MERRTLSKKEEHFPEKGRQAKASAEVKKGDIIAISFGNKEVKAEVLDVQETVKKEEAKELFRYL